ncbi:SDR family NAD(P)-dependent oxidoreductase [Streptomyces sp. cg40]|uniref:SDR family NAD(P)-dependent oxidoreductase n=1 Tax=Streptomyces sp. cg40 TaxID=3419764 RepID=UPI003CFFDC4D
MTGRLSGKVAVITGGASGIGLAASELFVSEGAKVVVADISDEAGEKLQARCEGSLVFQHTDVTEEGDIAAVVETAVREFGKLDVMYNNAGGSPDVHNLFELGSAAFDKTIALNTRAVVMGHKHAGLQFRKQGTGGSIVTTVSAAGMQGNAGEAAYAIAKHGVVGIIQQAVHEFGPHGIRSNGISPGTILTPLIGRTFGVAEDRIKDFNDFLDERSASWSPMRRLGRPIDIAEAALWFASDASTWVTGTVLPVDGGQTSAFGGRKFADIVIEAAEEFAKK